MSCQTPLRPLQSGAVNVAQVGLIAILIGVAVAGGLLLTNSLPPDDLAPAPAPASQPEASPPAEVETLAEPEQTPAPETKPEPAPGGKKPVCALSRMGT